MNNKIIAGIILSTGLAVGGATGYFSAPVQEIEVEKVVYQNQTVEVPVEVEKIVEKNVTIEVPVEVEKIVEVDNGNLSAVLEHIYDNNGKVQYLTSDLDDDEIDQIVDRIDFINFVKNGAVEEIEKELFDEIDGDKVSGIELDEDDLERLRVDDDYDELEIVDVDFEDKDAEVKVTGSFEQDDVEFEFEAIVEFKDGEVDEIKSISVIKN